MSQSNVDYNVICARCGRTWGRHDARVDKCDSCGSPAVKPVSPD